MRELAAAVSKISSNAAVAESCRGRLESGLSRNCRVGVVSEAELSRDCRVGILSEAELSRDCRVGVRSEAEVSREVARATTEDLTMDDERMSREKVKVDGGIGR